MKDLSCYFLKELERTSKLMKVLKAIVVGKMQLRVTVMGQ